jgi:hypothetical protein
MIIVKEEFLCVSLNDEWVEFWFVVESIWILYLFIWYMVVI